jgi:hypothetical protein
MLQDKWKDDGWFNLDYSKMDYEELIELREHVLAEHSKIKGQVDKAKREGVSSDKADWLSRAEGAIRSRGHTTNVLSRIIKERKVEIAEDKRREENIRWERTFVQVVKGDVPEEDFARYCDLANKILGR